MSENTETILVVDDEPTDREMLRSILHRQDYHVIAASDARQAMKLAEKYSEEVNLLITDVSLPGTNGCELATAALRMLPDLKILFVSGYTGAEIFRYYGIPFTDMHFLRKPFTSADLSNRVRQVLNSAEPLQIAIEPGDDIPDMRSDRK